MKKLFSYIMIVIRGSQPPNPRGLTHAPFAEMATVSAGQQQMPNHPGGLFLLLGQVFCPYQKQQMLNQKGTGCLVRTDSALGDGVNTHAVVL